LFALLGSVAGGPTVLAVVVTPVVVLAVLSARRDAGRGALPRPRADDPGPASGLQPGPELWALLVLGLVPLAALAGVAGAAVALVAGAAATARFSPRGWGRPDVPSLLRVIAPAVAGGALVLDARQGTELVTVLVIAVLLFDVANSVMGTGRTGGFLGAVSGSVTVLVFAVIVNALLEPPFTGSSSWVLCGLVGVMAPLGVGACGRLVRGRAPAVRRLDSLVLAAPAWWLGVVVLLHR
jgi:hypothetical protein